MKLLGRGESAAVVGVLYAASLWLSNAAYLYLSVSFIQMTKSLMPGLVYATGILMGTEQFTRASAANMLLIAFGVVVCAIGEVNLVLKGVLQQLAALLFEVGIKLFCSDDSSCGGSVGFCLMSDALVSWGLSLV
jgi:EamA domain-containing membrane protein RarD